MTDGTHVVYRLYDASGVLLPVLIARGHEPWLGVVLLVMAAGQVALVVARGRGWC